MSMILFRNGKIVGPISDWQNAEVPPEYKEVLGKTVLVSKANDSCTFTSPKPLNRRDELTIVDEGRATLVLQIKRIVSGLQVSAIIKEKRPLR